ncbi:hypothetical protein BDV34DRAFT_74812 [Aspergillus parasiticus]|uniref:Uncharacterized protein n=1 Tax=Aspergillus parasiticus TaxID=5067 RepID=A0A5N6DPP1_ASPPA|nr:hypothetical protein BDV34DRAFT_74812 [Aspergillus parasiticus]
MLATWQSQYGEDQCILRQGTGDRKAATGAHSNNGLFAVVVHRDLIKCQPAQSAIPGSFFRDFQFLFHTQASRWQSTTIATYTYTGSTHVLGRQSSVGREKKETDSETRPGVDQLLSAVLFCTIKVTADRNRLGAPRGIATHARFAEIKDDKIRGPEAGNLRASWWATGRATRENDDTRLKKVKKSTACGRVDDRQPRRPSIGRAKAKVDEAKKRR